MDKQIKIIVADDHQLFRIGLVDLLKRMDMVDEVFPAENGQMVLEILARENVDIVFMDVSMPILNGCQTTKIIKEKYPKVNVIALSMYNDRNSVFEMVAYGARGYITKNTDLKELELAMTTVLSGSKYFTPEIANTILNGFYNNESDIIHLRKMGIITSQEKEIIRLLSDGVKTEQIGEIMKISPKTVEGHKSILFRKTGTSNVASLVKYALKNKLIEW